MSSARFGRRKRLNLLRIILDRTAGVLSVVALALSGCRDGDCFGAALEQLWSRVE